MKRRTILQQVGAAAAGTAVLAGSASAEQAIFDVGEPFDVSDVSGEVSLDELLDEPRLAGLPEDVDPTSTTIVVGASEDVISDPICCFTNCGYLGCAGQCDDCSYL